MVYRFFAQCSALALLVSGAAAQDNAQLAEETTQAGSEPTATTDVITVFSRVPQTLDQVGSATSIVSGATIELQGIQVLDEALERTPGVSITRSGGFGQNTQVRMRGFTTKHTLTIIDGVKITNPAEFDNQFGIEHVMLDNIEQIEVLRGPQSGIYGADAVAGVISIVTARGAGDPDLRLSAMAASNDTYELSVGSQGAVANGRLGYSASLSWFDTGGISLASRAPGNVEDDGYENISFIGNIDYDITGLLSLRAGARYSDSNNDTDTNFTQTTDPNAPFFRPDLPSFLFQDSDGSIESRQGVYYAGLNYDGARVSHDAQISYTNLETESDEPGGAFASEGEGFELQYYATIDIGDFGFLGPDSFLVAGADHRQDNAFFDQTRGFEFAAIDESLDNTGVFLTANLELAEGLFLSLSGRIDDNERFGDVSTGRAAIAYTLPSRITGASDIKLRASYGTGREAPGLRQLLGRSLTFEGNPNLQPEETWMYDAGIDASFLNDRVTVSLTGYVGEADDGIFNVFDPVAQVSRPQNISSVVEMSGIELESLIRFTSAIDLSLAYTNASSEIAASGQQLFGRPENEFSFALTARATDKLTVVLDGYARSEFFSDYPSTFELDGYQLLNANAAYDLNDQVTLRAGVKNIFDEDYEEKLGDSAFGRTFEARITVRF
ncbi:MAG: TonB-dependent receptor [Pseudomonadota bacterium]